MSLQVYVKWVDFPGCRTTFEEGRAGIQQLTASRELAKGHTFSLLIAKTTLYDGCDLSSKLLPLVISMSESRARRSQFDVYSFDNKSICLSHGYSITRNKRVVADEQHDTDVSRLVEHGALIRDLIGEYPIPAKLAIHPTVIDLRNNSLRR